MSVLNEVKVKAAINQKVKTFRCGVPALYSDSSDMKYDEDGDESPIHYTIRKNQENRLKEKRQKEASTPKEPSRFYLSIY